MKGLISLCGLYNVFFVLGFYFFTYVSNIYIVFAFAVLFCCFLSLAKECRKILYIYFITTFLLVGFYYIVHDVGSAYRIFKTLTLVWITLFIPIIDDLKINKLLHYFLLGNALLVYIDVLLYNTLGFSLTNGVGTYGYIRFSGVIEDSNFFSYMLFCYVYYLKVTTGKFNYFLIGAILLSFSLSLILTMVCVCILLQVKFLWKLSEIDVKILGGIVLVVAFLIYYGVLFALTTVRDVDTSNGYITEKFVSLSLRFESQLEAIDVLTVDGDCFWGIGAGKTREITTKEMNLHNTYLQILLEMGVWCLLIVFTLGIFCYRYLDKYFVLLFVALFLLGNVLEVFYFPLLSFILFLSISYKNENKDNNLAIT